MTAWAQQTSPSAAETEAALRARVERFYQMEVDKKFRQAEAFVGEDSKDAFYNSMKPDIQGFSIDQIELKDNNTRAEVSVKVKITLQMPGFNPMHTEAPIESVWKIEKGEWVEYVDPEASLKTPFGKLQPVKPGEQANAIPPQFRVRDLAGLQQMVKLDRDSIVLTAAEPDQTVTVSNGLPGSVDLSLVSLGVGGIDAALDKTHLNSGEKAVVRIRAKEGTHGSGAIQVQVSPLGQQLIIRVTAN